MRLVDVCIPKFDDEVSTLPLKARSVPGAFQLPSAWFGSPETEYHIEDDMKGEAMEDNDSNDGEGGSREELFFEADDGTNNVRCNLDIYFAQDLTRPFSTLNYVSGFSSWISRSTSYELPYQGLRRKALKGLLEMFYFSELFSQ